MGGWEWGGLSHSKRFKRGKSPKIVQRQIFGVLAEKVGGKGVVVGGGSLQNTLLHS